MSTARLKFLALISCFIFFAVLTGATAARAQKSSPPPVLHQAMWRGQPVTYVIKNGLPIYQGDIILDHLQPMPGVDAQAAAAQSALDQNSQMPRPMPMSVGVAFPSTLWPKVGGVYQVPYVITSDGGDANLTTAINQFNSTFTGLIQWVARTTETNYVNIDLDSSDQTGECEATEGDANIGAQPMNGSGACTLATLLHEMGHEIGLYHEQSRSDRDTYVSVNYSNLILASRGNFDIVQGNVQNLTLFDYASVMEYPPFSFSRNGGPAVESIPAGIPLSNSTGYTAADIEGIERLYGAPPATITVTSNPPGLDVIIDGSTLPTPQTFSWALNSTHTLNVPTNVQTVSGDILNSDVPTTFYYTYGRWNDNAAASHTITVTPGNGELAFPATLPQVSTYTANFVQIVPYTSAVSGGTGTVTPSPAVPQSYPGVSGVYFTARQQVTLSANATGSSQFYEFNNSNFWLPGGLGANPKTFYVPDTGLGVNVTAEMAPVGTVYTVDVSPDAFSSNLYAYVDGTFWYTPKNFAPSYDSAWTANSTHTIDVDAVEQPYSSNTRFAFSSWSDSGAQSHSITLPGSGTSYIATLTPQFFAADNFSFPPCGGNATLTPASPTGDGFYPSGQLLTYTATPDATWTFAGWTYSLTGTTNPGDLTATDETLVYANFNTTNTPLTLTSISPNSAASGGASFTLTLTGTGFTSGSLVNVNGAYLTPTIVSSTELQVTVPASDLSTVTNFQVYVENFPSGWNGCANFGYAPFFVYQGTSAPVTVTVTPTTLTFASQTVGTTSAAKAVTVKNTSTTSTSLSLGTSGDFAVASTGTCGTSLAAGASCTVNVTFTPTAAGTRTGTLMVTDQASNSPQSVTLTGTGTNPVVKVTVTPTSETFASQTVGTTSAAKVVTVKNTSTLSTTLSLGITGDFAIASASTCGSSLAAGASCTVDVTFTPTQAGTRTGTLTVTDQASNSPQTVNLTGTGTNPVPMVTVTPTSETFASQTVGTTSAAKVVTVKNTSTLSTTLSLGISGDFAIAPASTCGSGLAGGASCTVDITFTPTQAGTRTGTVTVTDQAANSPQKVSLTGTGTNPVPTITVTPTSLMFASQTVNTTSAAKAVTVKNTSTVSTSLSLGTTGDFAIASTSTCGSSLAGGASCTVNVTFTPTQSGALTGSLTITDQAANSPQTVTLKGTGAAPVPKVTATPATLSFPATTVGKTSAGKPVTIKNTGTASTTLSLGVSGDFAIASSSTCGASLAAGASCTATITFTPTQTGTRTGALTVTDQASNSPQSVTLTGTGE